jgi:hypothetical protein
MHGSHLNKAVVGVKTKGGLSPSGDVMKDKSHVATGNFRSLKDRLGQLYC